MIKTQPPKPHRGVPALGRGLEQSALEVPSQSKPFCVSMTPQNQQKTPNTNPKPKQPHNNNHQSFDTWHWCLRKKIQRMLNKEPTAPAAGKEISWQCCLCARSHPQPLCHQRCCLQVNTHIFWEIPAFSGLLSTGCEPQVGVGWPGAQSPPRQSNNPSQHREDHPKGLKTTAATNPSTEMFAVMSGEQKKGPHNS